MTNEKLIANRIWKLLAESIQGEVDGTTIPVPVEDIRRLIDAREKTLGEATAAPTDDERQQLDDIMAEAYGYWPPARALILERFRRTEVPEPSAAETDAMIDSDLANGVLVSRREPQGETFSEVPEPSREDGRGIASFASRFAEPQGDPSDARIEAALVAYWGSKRAARKYGSPTDMRAALRAALRAANGVR